MDNVFVLDSPALENAVKLRSTTDYPPRRPGRSSLKEVQATGGGGGGYAGYFTIIDISAYNEDGSAQEFKVAVCDGRNWDPSTQTSGDSYFKVSSTGYNGSVACTKLKIPNSGLILLRYCHGTKKADVIFRKEHPYGNTGYYYCVLGSVKISDGKMAIDQLHGLGSVQSASDEFIAYGSLKNLIPVIEVKDYTGFFCIRMIEPEVKDDGSVDAPTSYAVCDGNSWDPATQKSEKSVVAVNNKVWNLEPKVFTFQDHHYIAIRYEYTAGENPDSVSINTYKGSVPDGVYDSVAYGFIGHLGYNWKELSQIHTGGVLQMWAFTKTCGVGDDY